MRFFNNCSTLEDVKAIYKKLALQYHPDRGGDTATMQAINSEYAFICARITKGGKFTAEEAEQHIKLSEEYRKVIEQILSIPGIIIEVVGNWIWVTGDTYPVRGRLKAAGLQFAPKKLAWYYRNEAFKTTHGKKTLEEIRRKYGSERVDGRSYPYLR